MACIAVKLIDMILVLFFLMIAVFAPLFDSQVIFPKEFYPQQLLDVVSWYAETYGDYLFVEKPNFFVGLVWMELLFLWPLALINLFAVLSGKSWFKTTCLLFSAPIATITVAMISELKLSGKASEQLLMIYYAFLGLAVLAILRGLLPCESGSTTSSHVMGKRPAPGFGAARKKRA